MLKIRLHGKEKEIEQFVNFIKRNEVELSILSESDFYEDRGKSVYVRQYLDVEINDKEN